MSSPLPSLKKEKKKPLLKSERDRSGKTMIISALDTSSTVYVMLSLMFTKIQPLQKIFGTNLRQGTCKRMQQGTALIESINLNRSGGQQLFLNPQVFARMHNMKFLKVSITRTGILEGIHFHLPDDIRLYEGLEYLPDELRLLDWRVYPLKSLPSTFCAKNLVQLIMTESKLKKLWNGVMPLGNLKKIDLSFSEYLVELPDFCMAKNLEEVKLSGCSNLCLVHPSILSLPKLEKLILSRCEKLTSLGSNVHSKSLQLLNLRGCRGLKEFSVTSENMIDLNLSCTTIKELPLSIASQRKLEYLILYKCESLRHLPSNFVDLQSLSVLDICECEILQYVPMLPLSIKQVYATNCRSLKTVQLDPLRRNITYFFLENCMELDEDSCNAVELTGRRSLTKFAFKSPEECRSLITDDGMQPRVIYPGSKVPKWFKYRTSQGSITMTIDPHSKLLGFIFCMILHMDNNFSIDCLLENNDGEMLPLDNEIVYITYGNEITELDLDHVCMLHRMWWDNK